MFANQDLHVTSMISKDGMLNSIAVTKRSPKLNLKRTKFSSSLPAQLDKCQYPNSLSTFLTVIICTEWRLPSDDHFLPQLVD